MLALSLKGKGGEEQLCFRDALGGQKIRNARLAGGDGAGFVEHDDLGFARLLERDGGFEEDAVFRAEAVADHDRHGRGEAERAGAADDEHRDAAREGERERRPREEPDNRCNDGDRDDRRDEDAGDLVRDLRNRRFGGGGVGDHFDDLREGRVLADARGLAAQEAGLIDRGGGDGVARGFVHGDALAGEGGLVDGTLPFQNDAVDRDALARADEEHIAPAHLLDGHDGLDPAALDGGRLRREGHEAFERIGGLALASGLEHFADGDEREDHGGGLEIKLVHVGHDGLAVARLLGVGHGKERVGAPDKAGARAEGDKRVHIRRAVQQALKAGDEKLLIDDHDDRREQELHQPHGDVVAFKPLRQRPAPHHMAHGKIHEHGEEAERGDEAALQDRRLAVGERIRRRSGGFCLTAGFERGAVARVDDGGDDLLRGGGTLDAHGVCEQAHRAGRDAGDLGDGFFHTGGAGGAAHAGDIVLFHSVHLISSAFEWWRRARR